MYTTMMVVAITALLYFTWETLRDFRESLRDKTAWLILPFILILIEFVALVFLFGIWGKV